MFKTLWVLVTALALSEVAVTATSIYLHRTLAHRALVLHPVVDVVFRMILWITTGQKRQEWVAVHLKHHTFTDREGDPHSPRLLGFWHVQLLNAYYYAREARNPETLQTFAPNLSPDWLDRHVFSHTMAGPWVIGLGMLVAIFGWWGIAVGLVHAVLYVLVLAPLINGLGHWAGYKNFDNTATNNRPLAPFTAGEALHNNHHAYPRAPKFSFRDGKRFEFDPSWGVIRVLATLGLATKLHKTIEEEMVVR